MQRNSKIFNWIKILADFLIIGLLVAIRDTLVFDNGSAFSLPNLFIFFVSISCWMVSARLAGLYRDFSMIPFSIEWVTFLKTMLFYTLSLSFVFFQFSWHYQFRTLQLLFHSGLLASLLPMQKLLLRIIYKRVSNSNNIRRKVLIVGATDTGLNFYEHYVKNQKYGYWLTGFVDDENCPSLNGSYLGKVADLEKLATKHEFDDIVVALPATDQKVIEKIVLMAEREGKQVRIIPNYQQFGEGKLQVDKFGNLSMITLRSQPLDLIDNKIYKRILDIAFSLLVITCILSWLVPIIAIVIKLTSRGPVFFKQKRWGLNNKNFTCLKFRTMVAGCKDVSNDGKYQQACKDDPRITKVGGFLRKTSLDELPQFFNVLIGSMSVVGPRPHPVPLNMSSKDNVKKYKMRHMVKPGITGWAQVNGYRGETKDLSLMKERVRHDLWYIENWTFWLDLQIVVQTLVNIVKGEKNAY